MGQGSFTLWMVGLLAVDLLLLAALLRGEQIVSDLRALWSLLMNTIR